MGTMPGWYTRRKNKSEYEAALCEKAEKYGEQRAVEGICKWLREGMLVSFGIAFPTLSDAIERGEWRDAK